MRIIIAYFEKFIETSGGLEHMSCTLANAFAEKGHDVAIVYCFGREGKPFYQLNPAVKLYNLMAINPDKWKQETLGQCIPAGKKLIRELIRVVSKSKARNWNEKAKGQLIVGEIQQVVNEFKPDVILSMRYETSNYIINSARVTVPVVSRSFMAPKIMLRDAPQGEIDALKKSYAVHVQLKEDTSLIQRMIPGINVVWIPNPVPQYEKHTMLENHQKPFRIINVARLNKAQKRQHLLIEAFSRLAKQYPDWNLEFWGEENDGHHGYKEELLSLIAKHHLENRVFLRGQTNKVYDISLGADIFAFPSAYEGFSNAMAEALSVGLPNVVYRSAPAVSALVEDGVTGLLCDDGPDGLAKSLKILMDNRELRVQMGRNATKSMQQFSPEAVFDKWESILKQAAFAEK